MRSAERGPTPGIWRSCATKSRSAAGYSVFLNDTLRSHLSERRFSQIQRERFEAAKIQLQRRVFFLVRPARLLKFRIRLRPAFLAVEHDAIPETIAPRELFGLCFRGWPKRFVNFVTLAGIDAAQKIDRSRDNIAARELERARADQDARTIKTVRNAKTPRQLDRFAA